jgi:glutamyl-tRNA synthetase
MSEVRVRIAPSPTGDPHVGTAYIALFDMAFARHEGGKFVLRIEDTDRERSTKESEAAIFRALRWAGIEWDEGPDVGGPYGPYRQSERSDIYKDYAQKLIDGGHAYHCFCTSERLKVMRDEMQRKKQPPMYDGLCRELPKDEVESRLAAGERAVVRLKVPKEGETSYVDLVRKKGEPVVFQNSVIDDQVLMKSDGFPTYHLANVVDDHLMKITHVIRAEEWVNSTPKHVMLYKAFGWEPPQFAHMPLLRNQDKSKISKRKNPTSLDWYREQGFLPEAMLNFLALMGFSTEEGEEIFDLDTMVREFSWDRVSTSAPIFDLTKLEWLNGMTIRNLSVGDLTERLRPFAAAGRLDGPHAPKMVEIIQERMKTLSEFDDWTWFFFTDDLPYEAELLVAKKMTKEGAVEALTASITAFDAAADWTAESLESLGRGLCEQLGLKAGQLFMTLRIAVTGSAKSPPLFESMEILGKERCIARLRDAFARLAGEER